VNVRAIVTATRADPNATGHIEGWEEYDFEAIERDADDQPVAVQIRCDQNVSVEADNQEDAVENAKTEATDIVIEGYTIDDVTLWVDEGIDITLVQPEASNEWPDDYVDPHQQELAEFTAESVTRIQNGETTIEAAAAEFAARYELPVGFVASGLSQALEDAQNAAVGLAR
jgi:1,2-phenylacetyl-CoA epoxidase PaaB subunit